jgi:hypothetical protein
MPLDVDQLGTGEETPNTSILNTQPAVIPGFVPCYLSLPCGIRCSLHRSESGWYDLCCSLGQYVQQSFRLSVSSPSEWS